MIKKSAAKAILITGLAIGLAAGGFSFSPVQQASAAKKVTVKVKLTKKKLNMKVGQKATIKAKVSPARAKIKWSSSKSKVASVTTKGKITAKAAGTAVISANATYKKAKKRATCKVVVKPADLIATNVPSTAPATQVPSTPAPTTKAPATAAPIVTQVPYVTINSIKLKDETITLNLGKTYSLAPNLDPGTATLADCNITSSKDYVASVKPDGTISADYIGTSFITVSSKANPAVNSVLKVNVTNDFSAPEGFSDVNSSYLHGELTDLNYPSDYREGGKGHARMWLPPNYDVNKKYNLLLCLHGGTDTEYYWTVDGGGANDGCKAQNVLDYLYANNMMEDTIVVFPHGVIPYDANKDYPNIVPNQYISDSWKDHYLLEFEILNNLLPYIRENLPVYDTADHTALCGLSMGCAQSMEIAFKNPEVFDYVGCYSAGPFEDAEDDDEDNYVVEQPFVNSFEDAQKLNDNLKLLFFITGQNDRLHDASLVKFIKWCNDYDLNNVFYEVPGVGHDDYCWDKCLYAFMQYAFK